MHQCCILKLRVRKIRPNRKPHLAYKNANRSSLIRNNVVPCICLRVMTYAWPDVTRNAGIGKPKRATRYVGPCIFARAFNPLNPEINPICYLLALLGAHHFLYVSRIRVKLLTFRLLMSYIYGAPILDVFRSHTTTQHSR